MKKRGAAAKHRFCGSSFLRLRCKLFIIHWGAFYNALDQYPSNISRDSMSPASAAAVYQRIACLVSFFVPMPMA